MDGGVRFYECTEDGVGGSYAYVCNGAEVIQQLGYSTLNYKGTSTLIQHTTFQDMGMVCQYNSDAKVYSFPTCFGPASMN
jgi:hypothetical protein